MKKYLLIFIFLTAAVLRLPGLDNFPVGFTQDEAAIGYDSYSLLETGKDMWGNSYPLVLRSFGDFKMPLYSYIAMPSIAVFGLSEFSVRLPNAILGSLAVLATYFMVFSLSKRRDLAMISSALLATSPWHIALSRGAFEANLTTFLIPVGVWAFIRGVKDAKFMSISAVAFGLNLFSYHSARIFTPLLIILLIVLFWQELTKKSLSLAETISRYKFSILILSLLFMVTADSMFMGANNRGLDVTIFNPTDNWAYVADRRYEAVIKGLPDSIARVFSNKAFYVFDTFVSNYVTYFSPIFFFTEGVRDWGYGMIPGRGVLYMFEVFFVIASIVALIKGKRFKGMGLILLWILLSPIPAALSKGAGFTGNRAAVMMPAIQIFSAYGLVYILDLIKQKNLGARVYRSVIIAVIVVWSLSLVTFLEDYIYHAPVRADVAMQQGRKEMVMSINDAKDEYDMVVVSRQLSVPHIWIAFYNKWDPKDLQAHTMDWLRYEEQGLVSVDQLGEYQLGKYMFKDIHLNLYKGENVLLVAKPVEFRSEVEPIKTLFYPNGDPAVMLVDSKDIK